MTVKIFWQPHSFNLDQIGQKRLVDISDGDPSSAVHWLGVHAQRAATYQPPVISCFTDPIHCSSHPFGPGTAQNRMAIDKRSKIDRSRTVIESTRQTTVKDVSSIAGPWHA